MVNEPQFGYSAGMGFFFIHPPMANWLKSSQGLQERSRFDSLKPHPPSPSARAELARNTARLAATRTTAAATRRMAIEDVISLPGRHPKQRFPNPSSLAKRLDRSAPPSARVQRAVVAKNSPLPL